jgi:hypothetical protein
MIPTGDFTWKRTHLSVGDGHSRSYEGALALHSGSNTSTKFILRVTAETRPWHWYHRIMNPGTNSLPSNSIGPDATAQAVDEWDFDELRRGLQQEIEISNGARAPLGELFMRLILCRVEY